MARVNLEALQQIKSSRALAIQQLLQLEKMRSRPGFDDDASMPISSAQEHRQVKEYVSGITRWKRWLDFLIESFYKGEFEKMEPLIVQILRLGAYDLLFLRTPPHASINEAVELAKRAVREGAGGLVNGILRSIDRNRDNLPKPRARIRANELGVKFSHPNWLVYRWLQRYPDKVEDLLEWNNTRPVYSVRINKAKISVDAFKTQLDELEVAWEPAHHLEDFVRVPRLQPLVRQGFLRDGLCAVQDESSGLIVCLLDPKPGETIIDACAAPGGKAIYAASLMEGKGSLEAVDIQEERLKKLDQVIERYDATWIKRTVGDLRTMERAEQVDKVLLDAPCSGLGVLSKRADLRWTRQKEDIPKVAELQAELLAAAAKMVKPGGYVVYSTCTIAPEENKVQVKKFLDTHPDFERERADDLLPAAVVNTKGCLATLPHKHKMDGVFGVRLRKKS
ncbi:MAG: 16S rRNA (cytosine(967)-C(5))-methyltransferase RsmB [Bacteroidota bacterium]